MEKPSREVKLVSALLFIYPLFVGAWYLLLSEQKVILKTEELLSWGFWFVFYGILAYGVLRLNWKMRLVAIAFSIAGIAGSLLGIIFAPLVNIDMFLKALRIHGASIIIWKPLAMFFKSFGPSMLYLAFIIYKLTRPAIKEQFKEGDMEKSHKSPLERMMKKSFGEMTKKELITIRVVFSLIFGFLVSAVVYLWGGFPHRLDYFGVYIFVFIFGSIGWYFLFRFVLHKKINIKS